MRTDLELGSWAELSPEELMANPRLVAEHVGVTEPWKAIAYARRASSPSYDDLAYRIAATTPCRGVVPVKTIAQSLVDRERDREPLHLRRLRRIHDALRPRALDLPVTDGKLRYEFKHNSLDFFVERESSLGVRFEELWSMGRSHPPRMLLREAVPRDASATLNQHYSVPLPHAAWVSLSTLIDVGRFLPRQQWEELLVKQVEASRMYLFVSHRWQTPNHPDPDGREASLLAWQLIDHLCEAVLIASRRGLHEPRQFVPNVGQFIGLAGRELAELLIVNVLRPRLNETQVALAATEAAVFESHLGTGVIETASADIGLGLLRALLAQAPVMCSITESLCLWYDFASLPQAPRSADDEDVFQAGLRNLGPMQMMGNTVVLVDLPEHYLSRAWCTLEAIGANVSNQDLVLLHAKPRTTAAGAEVEHYFVLMMKDRNHVVRRAVLDTFLFQVQTPQECFERLRIALTETTDLRNVFELMLEVSYTPGAHIDGSSVVTGCWPLAIRADGHVILPVRSPRLMEFKDREERPGSLDWTRALVLRSAVTPPVVPAHIVVDQGRTGLRAHVIAIAGCEGDAVLIAGWAQEHLAELEAQIDASTVAISWISEDIVPVGHMPWGRLEPVEVPADMWVVVAPIVFLEYGNVARRLLTAAAVAGLERVTVAVDAHERNVSHLVRPTAAELSESIESVPSGFMDLRPISGGIFAAALTDKDVHLFQAPREAPPREEPPLVDQAKAPEQLQVILVNAVFKNNGQGLDTLCRVYPRSIAEQFKSWMRVPEELRAPPEQARAYVDAVVRIARHMKELGFDGPLKMLHSPDDNPIHRWYREFEAAQALAAQGDLAASTHELEGILTEMQGASGNAVADLRPKILGKIGANYFSDDRIDLAREFTRQALEASREVGDDQGVSIYQQNLQLLDSVVTTEDERVSKLARAQDLSDQGRYEASNAILGTLTAGEDSVVTCKVQGLLGTNYYWLGDQKAAAQHTEEAVSIAHRLDDPDPMRVYGYNLSRIITREDE